MQINKTYFWSSVSCLEQSIANQPFPFFPTVIQLPSPCQMPHLSPHKFSSFKFSAPPTHNPTFPHPPTPVVPHLLSSSYSSHFPSTPLPFTPSTFLLRMALVTWAFARVGFHIPPILLHSKSINSGRFIHRHGGGPSPSAPPGCMPRPSSQEAQAC